MTTTRRKFFVTLGITGGAAWLSADLAVQQLQAQSPDNDVILKAMRDELERSRQLRVPDDQNVDDVPYFISYTLDDAENFSAVASLGALTGSNHTRFRAPLVEVRVGSYDFDNTGHVLSGYSGGSRYDTDPLPLDDIYDALRERFWLATDFAFKASIESIARKRAALRSATAQPDRLADFVKGEPVTSLEKVTRASVDEDAWSNRITQLSAVFRTYPEIFASSVEVHLNQGTTYLVDTEGTALRYRDDTLWLAARAEGQAADGMPVREALVIPASEINALPNRADAETRITQMAKNVQALVSAPVGDAFTGPVLFEPMAAAQLFAQLIGENARPTRKPVVDPGRPVNTTPSEYEGRMGGRVLPDWFDVFDDPTQTAWQGRPLLGHYDFDFQGVRPQRVSLIEKGILKGFLATRQPIKNALKSNGHGRMPGGFGAANAAIGNLFVTARETAPLVDLKSKLLQLCKDRDLPYGIIIRKLDFPFSGGNAELQSLQSTSRDSGGSVRPVSPPVLAYKVYPDGREELVRGLRFKGMRSRSLRDILSASTEQAVFEFINNGALLARAGGGGYLAPASIIAPGVLFDELELDRSQEQLERPPLVAPPSA